MELQFDDLYDEHAERLFRYLSRVTGSDELAEDLLQEVFLRVFRDRRSFAQVADRGRYLYRMARNLAIDHLRGRRSLESLDDAVPASDANPAAGDDERAARLRAAFLRLPIEQREIVELHLYEGLTFKEAAELLDENANTLASRYRSALKKIGESIDERLSRTSDRSRAEGDS